MTPKLSILIVARNEEARLPDCLASTAFANEVVVVLDRTTDASATLARAAGAKVLEGAWGVVLAFCTGAFPLLSYLKARLEPERHGGQKP